MKKILAMLLCVAMALTLLPAVTFAEGAHEHCAVCNKHGCTDATHVGTVEYEPWSAMNRVNVTEDTNIYMDSDVTLSKAVNIVKGATLNLCLNGQTLDVNGYSLKVGTSKTGYLNLYDCGTDGKITGGGSSEAAITVHATSTFTMYSGNISGNTNRAVRICGGNASAHILGGKISGNSTPYSQYTGEGGGAIYLENGELVVGGDAEISGNSAPRGGAIGAFANAGGYNVSVTIKDRAKIIDNKATSAYVGAIYIGTPVDGAANGPLTISGNVEIYNNLDGNGEQSNIHSQCELTIAPTGLGDDALIYVSVIKEMLDSSNDPVTISNSGAAVAASFGKIIADQPGQGVVLNDNGTADISDDVLQLTLNHTHDWNKDKWVYNDSTHWHACRGCTARDDEAAHTTPISGCVCQPHTHGNGILQNGSLANCATETNGSMAYYLCSCGGEFYDEACTQPVADDADLVIPWAHTGGEATCVSGKICTVCSTEYTAADGTAHSWATPEYTWAADNSTCTATRVCTLDSTHMETETGIATSSITQPQNCEKPELTTYTATFANTAFVTQTKEVQTKEALEHSYVYADTSSISQKQITESCVNGCNHSATVILSVNPPSTTYTGEALSMVLLQIPGDLVAQQPVVQYTLNGAPVSEIRDAGAYTASITLGGVTISVDVTVYPKPLTPTIEVADAGVYDGTEKKPAVVVKDGHTVLDPSEYTVTYTDNINAGEATVTITDKPGGNYDIVQTSTTFTIAKATYDMSGVTFADATYTYDGTAKTLTITGSLPAGVSVSYRNNTLTNAGSITATASFTGDSNHELILDMTATLTIINPTFPVTLITDGGTINAGDVTSYTYGTGAVLPTDVTRPGYTFDGWFTTPECTGEPVAAITASDFGAKVFYAKWIYIPPFFGSPTEPVMPTFDPNAYLPALLPFSDVPASAWYYDDVYYVWQQGLMNGTGSGKFSPAYLLNRATVMTTLYRLAGSPSVTGGNTFSDLPNGQWYTAAMQWGIENGIILGYGNDTCKPLADITREQLIAILHRYAKLIGKDNGLTGSIAGYTCSKWAKADVAWAAANGLLAIGTDISDLTATADRAEVAAFLHGFAEIVK